MSTNVVQFPRKPDPDVVYTAIKEFEPTAGEHVITVSAGKHKDGRATIAILIIGPEGCDEQLVVIAEWDEITIPERDAIAFADIARRAADYACVMVPVSHGGDAA